MRVTVERVDCPLCGSPRGSVEARGKDYIYCTSSQDYSYQRCSDCDHLYLNPRPAISEIETIYPNSYSTFTKRFGQPDSWLAKIKDKVLLGRFEAFAGRLPETMSLLDIGCGSLSGGRFAIRFLAPGHYFGIEPEAWLIEEATTHELDDSTFDDISGHRRILDVLEVLSHRMASFERKGNRNVRSDGRLRRCSVSCTYRFFRHE